MFFLPSLCSKSPSFITSQKKIFKTTVNGQNIFYNLRRNEQAALWKNKYYEKAIHTRRNLKGQYIQERLLKVKCPKEKWKLKQTRGTPLWVSKTRKVRPHVGEMLQKEPQYTMYTGIPHICRVYHTYIMYTTHTPWKYS